MTKQELLNELMKKKTDLENATKVREEKLQDKNLNDILHERYSVIIERDLLHIATIKRCISFLSYGE